MTKTFFIGLIALTLLVTPLSTAFAQTNESSVSSQVMQVEGVANLRDRIWERITLFFKFSNKDKADYEQYLTENRLAELRYVFDNDRGDMVEELSSRYSSYLGRLTDRVVKYKMVDRKEGILKMFDSHLPVLEELLSRQDYESGFWLLLKHDINYLKLYRDQIKNLN